MLGTTVTTISVLMMRFACLLLSSSSSCLAGTRSSFVTKNAERAINSVFIAKR